MVIVSAVISISAKKPQRSTPPGGKKAKSTVTMSIKSPCSQTTLDGIKAMIETDYAGNKLKAQGVSFMNIVSSTDFTQENFPACAIASDKGKMIAAVLVNDNQRAFGFTARQYRRRGFFTELTSQLESVQNGPYSFFTTAMQPSKDKRAAHAAIASVKGKVISI